ncbi:MAG TPA: hypothetical protein VGG98_10390 [Solirubrobacteraceae bacterium]|jgi:hypothetical protein
MATRTIVTSQPDVACDVCERRLLRGELPDVFLAAGQRRTVCELCAPRAAHEGWLREADRHSVSLPPSRARRGRNLLERLRQGARTGPERTNGDRPVPIRSSAGAESVEGLAYERETERSYDFLDPISAAASEEVASRLSEEPVVQHPVMTTGDLKIEQALEVFNAGEHPRRVGGVARSLGAPAVSVRPVEESGGVVAIVVAWELCWYRYEVDLGDEAAGATVTGQGTELDELAEADRLANAIADEHGALALAR